MTLEQPHIDSDHVLKPTAGFHYCWYLYIQLKEKLHILVWWGIPILVSSQNHRYIRTTWWVYSQREIHIMLICRSSHLWRVWLFSLYEWCLHTFVSWAIFIHFKSEECVWFHEINFRHAHIFVYVSFRDCMCWTQRLHPVFFFKW